MHKSLAVLPIESLRRMCRSLHLVCRRSRTVMIHEIATLAGLSPYYKKLAETCLRQEQYRGSPPKRRLASPVVKSPFRKATMTGLKVMCEDRGIPTHGLSREAMIRALERLS
ncbi:hypothetical protein EBZ80_06525 [bacterium]|nr:hypothetical protein [bacterium]